MEKKFVRRRRCTFDGPFKVVSFAMTDEHFEMLDSLADVLRISRSAVLALVLDSLRGRDLDGNPFTF